MTNNTQGTNETETTNNVQLRLMPEDNAAAITAKLFDGKLELNVAMKNIIGDSMNQEQSSSITIQPYDNITITQQQTKSSGSKSNTTNITFTNAYDAKLATELSLTKNKTRTDWYEAPVYDTYKSMKLTHQLDKNSLISASLHEGNRTYNGTDIKKTSGGSIGFSKQFSNHASLFARIGKDNGDTNVGFTFKLDF